MNPVRMALHVLQFHGCMKFEKLHPLQGGYFRRKIRTERRSGMKIENPLLFYPRRAWDVLSTYVPFGLYAARVFWLCHKVRKDPANATYTDRALAKVTEDDDNLEMLTHTEDAKAAVARGKKLAALARQHAVEVEREKVAV
jgi:hypothetical protein